MNRWIYQASNALHSIIHRGHVNVNTQRDLKIFSLFTLWENAYAYMFVECFSLSFKNFMQCNCEMFLVSTLLNAVCTQSVNMLCYKWIQLWNALVSGWIQVWFDFENKRLTFLHLQKKRDGNFENKHLTFSAPAEKERCLLQHAGPKAPRDALWPAGWCKITTRATDVVHYRDTQVM